MRYSGLITAHLFTVHAALEGTTETAAVETGSPNINMRTDTMFQDMREKITEIARIREC